MIKAQIISFWAAGNKGPIIDIGRFRQQVSDATGMPVPATSPLVVEIVVTQAVYDEILADGDYGEGSIMESENYEP